MSYKESFIQFMVESDVLCFGAFTLKSGRKAPYFINTGNYRTGAQLMQLGRFYAACMVANHVKADTLFGPAYKGIPLAAATAIALADRHGESVNFCFDRKEIKDHGEGGMFVGKQLEDGENVVIIEDVMTSGKAMSEVYPKLKSAANINVTGMILSIDRKERALQGEKSAAQFVREHYGVPVYSIVTIDDVIAAIKNNLIPGQEHLDAMLRYREAYGA